MGRTWLPAALAVGVAVGVSFAAGCNSRVADQPTGAPSVTTEQVMQTNPEFRKQILARLEDQINKSNLPPDEKQRQIAQLRANGPPK